ncbi:IS1/IS1595 family N-terminal zinc-binding domain-containing protein [Candidatus Cyrtobacter comes]
MLKCKKCSSVSYVKCGHIRGLQRYQCRDCGCQFTPTKLRGVSPGLKHLAVILYAHCGMSMLLVLPRFSR